MGLFNPWVLLASGEIKKVKKNQVGHASLNTKLRIDGENAIYIGKHKPTNISTVKAKEFLESGFNIEQIAKLTTSKKGVEIAELLTKTNGFKPNEIVDLVQKANKFGLDEQLERMLKSGKLNNPDKLKRMLKELDETDPPLARACSS